MVELKVVKAPADSRYLYVANWDRWQSYRRDRGPPPWIKIHKQLLHNMEWCMLTDAEKGQLVSIWILASECDGRIPADPKILQKMAGLESTVSTSKFIDLGFLTSSWRQVDVNMTTTCQPNDRPRRQKTEAEDRGQSKEILSTPKGVDCESFRKRADSRAHCPYRKIVDLYHEMLPSLRRVEKLTPTRKQYLRALWLDDLPDLEHWRNYFDFIRQSDFLMGRCRPKDGRNPFCADLEWITKPGNFTRISEEKYHG